MNRPSTGIIQKVGNTNPTPDGRASFAHPSQPTAPHRPKDLAIPSTRLSAPPLSKSTASSRPTICAPSSTARTRPSFAAPFARASAPPGNTRRPLPTAGLPSRLSTPMRDLPATRFSSELASSPAPSSVDPYDTDASERLPLVSAQRGFIAGKGGNRGGKSGIAESSVPGKNVSISGMHFF